MKGYHKNRIVILCAVLCAGSLLMASCGKGSRRDSPRAFMEKNLQVMEDFIVAMDQADQADQVVGAMDRYTREVEKLVPRIQAVNERYPEMAQIEETGVFPEEFKDLEEKFTAMGMKMMRAMVKAMQYGDDPKVQAAQERMIRAAEKLQ